MAAPPHRHEPEGCQYQDKKGDVGGGEDPGLCIVEEKPADPMLHETLLVNGSDTGSATEMDFESREWAGPSKDRLGCDDSDRREVTEAKGGMAHPVPSTQSTGPR